MENLYLLAILPNADISCQIHEIRKECAEAFNVKAALKPPVHISLHRPFKLDPRLEKSLLRVLAPAAIHNSFMIALENFDSFNVHTVFLRVVKHPELTALYRKISGIITRNNFDPKETKNSGSGFAPHISIAYRDIPAEVFPLMWAAFKDRKFKREFICDRFTLLKHDGQKWNVLREYVLKQEPETLSLF